MRVPERIIESLNWNMYKLVAETLDMSVSRVMLVLINTQLYEIESLISDYPNQHSIKKSTEKLLEYCLILWNNRGGAIDNDFPFDPAYTYKDLSNVFQYSDFENFIGLILKTLERYENF